MSKPTGINNSTLSWVKKELDQTLKQAAEALEAHSEAPNDPTQLRFCQTHLHQVHGILQMLELFGAAMLVEEMEQVVDALLEERVPNKQDAYEMLMRAILQLGDYLERIQAGLQDIPMLVLPLLNDLRATRGANLLTENALFSPDLDAMAAAPRRKRLRTKTLQDVIRGQRHRYQVGLLGFLREQNTRKSLGQMLEVLDKLDDASDDDQVGTLWWVAGGLVEALREEATESSPAVKMLLGHVDRQMKRVLDQGEDAFSIEPPRDLIKNLLYYVARAEPVGERVPAIQAQYGLKDLLLDEAQLEQARQGMSGPNNDILQTVANAIKEDLTGVKDALDLFVRGGRKDLDRLAPLADVLRRIADTLGVLGLGVPRGVTKEQIALVESLVAGGGAPDEAKLMEMAEALLYVESALDGLIRRPAGAEPGWLFSEESAKPEDRARSERELFELEYRHVYSSAINEVVGDVGRIKESIVKFIESGNGDDIAGIDERFAAVCGALRLLELDQPARLLQAAGRYVADHILPGHAAPSAEALDSLADAITSIEYYLEAIREGRAEPGAILEVAASGLEQLGYLPHEESAPAAVPQAAEDELPTLQLDDEEAPLADLADLGEAPADLAVEPADEAFEISLDDPALAEPLAEPELAVEPVAETPPVPEPAPEPKKTGRINYEVAAVASELDPDILEIFVEEAGEVLETLRSDFPRWRDNPEDSEALTTCRRMFHTLKGSGRLAGALLLGELAWSQENLLNRVLDHTVAPDGELYSTIEACIEALPELIAQIQGGPTPTTDVLAIMRRAEILSDPVRRGELEALNAAPPAAEPEAEAPEQAPEIDETPVLEAEATPVEAEPEVVAAEPVADELTVEPVAEPEGEPEEELVFELPDEIEAVEAPAPEVGEEVIVEAVAEAAPVVEEEPSFEIELGAPEMIESAEAEPVELHEPAAEEPAAPVESESTDMGMDPVLYDIFSRETADHLGVVREFVAEARATGGERWSATEGLVRALHTLTGSARMADVDPIARVGRKLEAYTEEHLAEERPLETGDLALLEQGADLVEALVSALAAADPVWPEIQPLLDAVDAARAEKAARAPESATVEAPPVLAVEEDEEEIAAASAGEFDQDLVELFLEEAQDILQFLETTVQRWEDQPEHAAAVAELHRSLHTLKGGARLAGFQSIGTLCHGLESLSGDVADHKVPADDSFFNLLHDSLDRLNDLVEAAKSGTVPSAPDDLLQQIAALRGGKPIATAAAQDTGADKELMEVFLEEAAEILEATETAIHGWQDDPENTELITEIQRALHTLKGGARMAGFQPIANLSHVLETLLIGVANGRVATSATFFDLLEQVHDALYTMREKAVEGQRLTEATDLLAAMEAMREGRAPAIPAVPAAPDEEAAVEAPVAEAAPRAEAAAQAEAAEPALKKPAAEALEKDDGKHDLVRVRADLLDNLVNFAGEVSIYRARLDQQVGAMRFNLTEFDQTVLRLREQLRTLEIETEAQILYRFEHDKELAAVDADDNEDFDPLEFDRFTRMQELSRALSESVNDLVSIQNLLDNLARESETLLLQQSRVNTELQDGLMRTRMVPFANLVPRMRRIVRQTCGELRKQAQFKVLGAQGEMDRTVLERVIPPLEHMLRNAVAHGIEDPAARAKAGKPAEGTITVALSREGADVVIRVSDDGGGMKLDAIRNKAVAVGLMPEGAPLTDREVMQFILEAGFSTAETVTQIAGRGVGMDVVASEIKQLGGTLEIDSVAGQGTTFTVRLPFTLAINQALLCQAGEDAYAIPLSSIEGVVRMTHEELEHAFSTPHQAYYEYANSRYEVKSLAQLLGTGEPNLPGAGKRSPIILVQTGDHRLAIQVDSLMGNREIVVKSVGPQISSVPGIYGATILADGRVVLILDVSSLARLGVTALAAHAAEAAAAPAEEVARKITIMVVDDSITMRKVATRLLERNGMEVVTAKDGVDAVARLQEVLPDAMLLDIEMPRMDGYELATHMRNDERLKGVPIIMITSRTGEKHRQRAMEIGVNRYLGKPYQESDLLENLRQVLEERRGRH